MSDFCFQSDNSDRCFQVGAFGLRFFAMLNQSSDVGLHISEIMHALDSPLLDPTLNSEACARANLARICRLCALRLTYVVMRRHQYRVLISNWGQNNESEMS